MSIYNGFARIYTKRLWPDYSRGMAKLLPELIKKYGIQPEKALDIACGEGTFVVEMAKAGSNMTGVDLSPEMLKLATVKAAKENVSIGFINRDMRELNFQGEFDLATCWFDSLNYLLTSEDLEKTFSGVAQALKPDGYFIFDIRTPYGLMDYFGFNISLVAHPCAVLLDSPDAFVLSRPEWDYTSNTVTWRITGFMHEADNWERIEETHKLRGYELEDVSTAAKNTGFTEIDCFGELLDMSGPGPDSKRLWFVMKKE
jgi:ubiquinone/menaquinone biosynthesis C-methylase UbiE